MQFASGTYGSVLCAGSGGETMRQFPIFKLLLAVVLLAGCSGPEKLPRLSRDCHQNGQSITDSVVFQDSGEDHVLMIYLPPCYQQKSMTAYPVIYWTNPDTSMFDVAERAISQGDIPPFIIVDIGIDANKGFGADQQIVEVVIPYIDAHYHTLADRRYRSITGVSNGGAIAIRAAFRAPKIFGRVAVLSGGIADGEQEKFTDWIAAMPSDQRPEVLIDVGEQDGIMLLSQHLMDMLDKNNYPYTFTHAPGDHDWKYFSSTLEKNLKWLVPLY
jgi:enterochelin esterase-like enzyme